jgi:hypothetical protein
MLRNKSHSDCWHFDLLNKRSWFGWKWPRNPETRSACEGTWGEEFAQRGEENIIDKKGGQMSLILIKLIKMESRKCPWNDKRLVLWSFKPGTYQTGSFAELTPKFQTCGTWSCKFRAPSPTPNDWDPRAAYHFYCTRAYATWWLTRFDWLSHNGAQSHQHKGMQELWWFRKSSWITQQEL